MRRFSWQSNKQYIFPLSSGKYPIFWNGNRKFLLRQLDILPCHLREICYHDGFSFFIDQIRIKWPKKKITYPKRLKMKVSIIIIFSCNGNCKFWIRFSLIMSKVQWIQSILIQFSGFLLSFKYVMDKQYFFK